jgi:hypothetical protein
MVVTHGDKLIPKSKPEVSKLQSLLIQSVVAEYTSSYYELVYTSGPCIAPNKPLGTELLLTRPNEPNRGCWYIGAGMVHASQGCYVKIHTQDVLFTCVVFSSRVSTYRDFDGASEQGAKYLDGVTPHHGKGESRHTV